MEAEPKRRAVASAVHSSSASQFEELEQRLAEAYAVRDEAIARSEELNAALFAQNLRLRRVVAQIERDAREVALNEAVRAHARAEASADARLAASLRSHACERRRLLRSDAQLIRVREEARALIQNCPALLACVSTSAPISAAATASSSGSLSEPSVMDVLSALNVELGLSSGTRAGGAADNEGGAEGGAEPPAAQKLQRERQAALFAALSSVTFAAQAWEIMADADDDLDQQTPPATGASASSSDWNGVVSFSVPPHPANGARGGSLASMNDAVARDDAARPANTATRGGVPTAAPPPPQLAPPSAGRIAAVDFAASVVTTVLACPVCPSERPMRVMTHVERLREDPAYQSGYECTNCGHLGGQGGALHCAACQYDLCPACAAQRSLAWS
jgi:hypothetical protein